MIQDPERRASRRILTMYNRPPAPVLSLYRCLSANTLLPLKAESQIQTSPASHLTPYTATCAVYIRTARKYAASVCT